MKKLMIICSIVLFTVYGCEVVSPTDNIEINIRVIPQGAGDYRSEINDTLITLTAIENPGYKFYSWRGDLSDTSEVITVRNSSLNLKLLFVPTYGSPDSSLVIPDHP